MVKNQTFAKNMTSNSCSNKLPSHMIAKVQPRKRLDFAIQLNGRSCVALSSISRCSTGSMVTNEIRRFHAQKTTNIETISTPQSCNERISFKVQRKT